MKPIHADELFNRRVIISELESSFNNDDAIDTSGITEVQTETAVVTELVQKEDRTVVEVSEEVESTVVLEK